MTAPSVLNRAQWGAAAPQGNLTPWPDHQPSGHTLHWEGAGGNSDHGQCAGEVRSIQRYHFSTGYSDIAYNWIVCVHGVIFEGRPVGHAQSAAQRSGNPLRVAICYMAGPRFTFSPAAQAAFHWLITVWDPAGSRGKAIGHRDEPSCSTSCPGPEIEGDVSKLATAVSPHPVPSPPPPPLPRTGVSHPTLSVGRVGPAIGELQRKLNGVTGTHLAVDGSFGVNTRAALENFQRYFHLAVDGVAGPNTWGLLDYLAAVKGIH